MEAPFSNLRLLDLFAAKRELDLASELFHRINRGNVERYLAPDGPKEALQPRSRRDSTRFHAHSITPTLQAQDFESIPKKRMHAKHEFWPRAICADRW